MPSLIPVSPLLASGKPSSDLLLCVLHSNPGSFTSLIVYSSPWHRWCELSRMVVKPRYCSIMPGKICKAIKKPVSKKVKGNPTVDDKGKKIARLISRLARNKPKPSVDQKPIVLSEDSDSNVKHFLDSDYPYSQGLCSEPPYDFVSNLLPCLRKNPTYPEIKLPNETLGDLNKPSPAFSKPGQSSCDQCNVWLECYYIDVPLLQLKIKSLENQVAVLTSERDKLQATDKKQKTTGSIVFRNVESATAFVNSKLL
jgi:hypothetical protein